MFWSNSDAAEEGEGTDGEGKERHRVFFFLSWGSGHRQNAVQRCSSDS